MFGIEEVLSGYSSREEGRTCVVKEPFTRTSRRTVDYIFCVD